MSETSSSLYDLGRMFTACLAVPMKSGKIFTALAQRPSPSYAVMTLNLLIFTALALVLAAVGAAVSLPFNERALLFPMVLAWSSSHAGVVAAIIVGTILAAGFCGFYAAAILHGLLLMCNGEGRFSRSYEMVSLLCVCLPLQAILGWFDLIWVLPALLAAYLAVEAASILHKAETSRAASIFSILAALCLAGQWWMREQTGRWMQEARGLYTIAQAAQVLSAGPALAAEPDCDPAATQCGSASPAQEPPASAPPSGLDYLLSPRKANSLMSTPPAPDQSAPQAAQAVSEMMTPLMKMLDDPQLKAGMSPEQAKQMQSMGAMLKNLQGAMADPHGLSPQQTAKMISQFQTMLLKQIANPPPLPKGGKPKPAHAP